MPEGGIGPRDVTRTVAGPASSGGPVSPGRAERSARVAGSPVPTDSPVAQQRAANPTLRPPDRLGPGASGPAVVRPVGPRRARLLLTRLDPWSVMKTSFMISLAVAIVMVVATAVLWWTLDMTGVFGAVNRTVDDVVGTGSTSFDFLAVVGFGRVMGITLVLAAVEIVLVSAMATLFSFLYNLTVGFTGGLELTLTEDS